MLNGIGREHNPEMHKITHCIHEEHGHTPKTGAMSGASAGVSARTPQASTQPEGLSLSAWMEKMLGGGKRFLRAVWGSSETAPVGESGDKNGGAQVLAQIRESDETDRRGAGLAGRESHPAYAAQELHTPQIAAAATALPRTENLENNPYFSAVEDAGGRRENFWQKMRVRFKDAAGRLTGRLPGKLFDPQAKSSFRAKQEPSKKELRRNSKFRRDEVEIDCVLNDDSYLLDSYDRKGEYSRLSARK